MSNLNFAYATAPTTDRLQGIAQNARRSAYSVQAKPNVHSAAHRIIGYWSTEGANAMTDMSKKMVIKSVQKRLIFW